MSGNPQAEALLGLVGAHYDTPADQRALAHAKLWGNPVICTPTVLALAEQAADDDELGKLDAMVKAGLIVVDEHPAARRAVMAGQRAGYENREMRRARRKGKGGKTK